jgi:hypothetical protein
MTSQNGLFGRSLLCHSILKFSHSTLPRTASPSGWNHIQASDLFALVEQLDHNSIQLRVIHGTNDLVGYLLYTQESRVFMRKFQEVLPLTAIIQETKELHRRQPDQSHESLPIFGLTKGTALAIRYFCQNNQVSNVTPPRPLERPDINIMVSHSRSDAFNCALPMKPLATKLYSFFLVTVSCSLCSTPSKLHKLKLAL